MMSEKTDNEISVKRRARGMNPKISVLIPCLNEESFIAQVLDNILEQDYQGETEIFLIDGMSTDRTRDIVKDYALQHAAIQLIDNPQRIVPNRFKCGYSGCYRGSHYSSRCSLRVSDSLFLSLCYRCF